MLLKNVLCCISFQRNRHGKVKLKENIKPHLIFFDVSNAGCQVIGRLKNIGL